MLYCITTLSSDRKDHYVHSQWPQIPRKPNLQKIKRQHTKLPFRNPNSKSQKNQMVINKFTINIPRMLLNQDWWGAPVFVVCVAVISRHLLRGQRPTHHHIGTANYRSTSTQGRVKADAAWQTPTSHSRPRLPGRHQPRTVDSPLEELQLLNNGLS